MKRIVLFLLVAVMIISMTACGSKAPVDDKASTPSTAEATQAETTQEVASGLPVLSPDNPVTLSTWITSALPAPADDNKITKLLKDKLGVTLEYEIIVPDNADQKTGVMLAGGEYPDLVGAVDLNARFILGGALIPLDDYLTEDKAKNLYEHVKPYWKRMSFDAGDGNKHIYIIPNFNRFYGDITGGTAYGASGFWLQKAVLEDAGYPNLDNMTLEKYFELIENYVKKNPKIDGQPTIGFEILCCTGREWGLTNPPEYLAGHPNNGGVIVDDNNVAKIFANTDVAKKYYQFLNQMNAKGLVDRESFTQTLDQYLAKLATGRVLGMYDQRWSYGNAYDALAAEGKDNRTWISTMPVYEGCEPYYTDRNVMNINQGFGISVSCEQPDIAMSFLDTIMSEEWQKILAWGIEGEDYLVDDKGMYYRTPEMREQQRDLVWRSKNRLEALVDVAPKHEGTYSDGNAYNADNQASEFFDTLREYDQNFLKAYNKTTWRDFLNQPPENPVYYPAWNITVPDGSDAQVANQQLTDTSMQYLPQMILANPSEFESLWQEYVTAIDGIDIKAYEDVVNAGIQERIASWGE